MVPVVPGGLLSSGALVPAAGANGPLPRKDRPTISSSSNPSLPWLPRGWAGRRQAWPTQVLLLPVKLLLDKLLLIKLLLIKLLLVKLNLALANLARASPTRGRASKAPMARLMPWFRPSPRPRWRGGKGG